MSEYIVDLAAHNAGAAMALCDDVHEEIVRCRDCKYTRKSWNGKRPDFVPDGFFCAYWGGHQLWEPNGFCAWGERKTNNKTGGIVTRDSGGKAVDE